MVIGFCGSGSMAAAMARGWVEDMEGMLFTDSGSGRAGDLAAEVGGEALDSNAELAERADLLVLAVKPARLAEASAELAGAKTVVSLLGATPLERLEAAFPVADVIRVMPNVAVEVRRGVLCVTGAESPQAREMLGLLGHVVETTAGSAELLRIRHPADVRAAVASPGGSTEAGLDALEAEGAREAFEAAVRASLERME